MKLRFISKTLAKRDLISQLIKRDVITRYKGSFLGITWALLNPLIMISVYTLVFSQIFQAKWGESTSSTNQFILE